MLLLKQLEGWCFPCVPPQYVLAVFPDLEAIFAGKPHVDMQKLEFLVLQAVLALVLRRIDECGTDGACSSIALSRCSIHYSGITSKDCSPHNACRDYDALAKCALPGSHAPSGACVPL